MNTKNIQKSQIAWINTLKGIACWVVFFGHFDDDFPYIPLLQKLYNTSFLFRFITDRTTALNVFYVIIGYLAANKFLNTEKDFASSAGKGIVKRYLRLALPVLLSNFIIIIIQRSGFGYGYGNDFGMFGSKYTIWEAFQNALVDGMFFGSTYFNPNMWMLNQLFIGYIFSVIICMILKNMKSRTGIFLLFLLCVSLWLSDCYLTTFIPGVLIYLITKSETFAKTSSIVKNTFGAVMIIGGCILSSCSLYLAYFIPETFPEAPFRQWWNYSWIAAMIIVAGIAFNSHIIKLLELSPLPKLGRICFPVYLFHRIWMASTGAWAYEYYYSIHQSKGEGSIAALFVCFSLTLVSSLIYIYFLEPPINKLTDFIMRKIMKEDQK